MLRGATLDAETEGIEEATVRESDEEYEDSPISPRADFASEASAPEVQISSEPAARSEGTPAPVDNVADDEADDARDNDRDQAQHGHVRSEPKRHRPK